MDQGTGGASISERASYTSSTRMASMHACVCLEQVFSGFQYSHPGHRSIFRRCRCRFPRGAHLAGSVGPHSDNVGQPTAAARCIGPLSLPNHSAARSITAASSGTEKRPNQHFPGGFSPARRVSAGLPIHATWAPRSRSNHSATARNRSEGQLFPLHPLPGEISTSGRSCWIPSSLKNAATHCLCISPTGKNRSACSGSMPKGASNPIFASAS